MADASQPDESQLNVERDGDVVVLTMNNPPRRKNALTPGDDHFDGAGLGRDRRLRAISG
ncbi:hypothetical protein ACTXG5_07175 [Mycobacterium sp. Dal123C01]|uniref:hypothetical protein n=1 Tax=Mycobacterium sp. Dal123C01 TaxID=3457577 RepID=UPI00403EC37E